MWTLAAFWVLVLAGATRAERRRGYAAKSASDWFVDLVGLGIQGALVPLLQLVVVGAGLALIAPGWRGVIELPGDGLVVGFLLNFVVVDYLYYWNHRLLHTRRLWPVHQVHHTVSELDVLGTSRNTVWTSLIIVYLWVNGTMVFLLAQPEGYVAGAVLTASLDLWRHSELGPRAGGRLDRLLGAVLVLPRDHAWHHSEGDAHGNFGANLKLWDRLHRTYLARAQAPARLGVTTNLPLWRSLFWPFA